MVFKLLLLCCILSVAYVEGGLTRFKGRIVNGNNATIEDYPYQVSLEHYSVHLCGGSIITPRMIATAAHCTQNKKLGKFKARVGVTIKERGGQLILVKQIFDHPKYNRINQNYDFSILLLEEDIVLSDSAKIIDLVDEDTATPAGETGHVSGWGRLSETESGPDNLQALSVPILDLNVCIKAYGKSAITQNMICAGYIEGGKDSCTGDSGGPLQYDGKLLGVISFGRGCARPGFPGVYASIPKVRDFIRETAGI